MASDSSRIDRRAFLSRGAGMVTAAATGWAAPASAADAPAGVPRWMQIPGEPLRGYGQPSMHEAKVLRALAPNYGKLDLGSGTSRTPLQLLEGTITPSGLHFERHHNGVPSIDPAQHKLLIHGLVRKPLAFNVEALLRYPMVSRTCFIECAGNSALNTLPKAPQVTAGMIHGVMSCSEWTGVPLSLLLNEAGLEPTGKWLLAEGADSAAMSRSIPVEKALEDILVALYQNGERIRPEQGYPLRLVVPGWEGNVSVKWLRRLKATEGPTHTKDETSKYTDLMSDGKARQFTFVMGVKSVITRPSGGMTMQGPGLYEVSGLAWSGAGRITRVEVSSDGGASWRDASFSGPSLPKNVVRFRLPWEWNGAETMLQSRATDDTGRVQESRAAWTAQYSPGNRFHNTMIQTWAVNADGRVNNVYL
ncbi:MAG: sulfite dehydrogenase [Betaproteobacteria bacterium]|nr:sulfite dehydrogenase [Betaproteobacteria bacterium]